MNIVNKYIDNKKEIYSNSNINTKTATMTLHDMTTGEVYDLDGFNITDMSATLSYNIRPVQQTPYGTYFDRPFRVIVDDEIVYESDGPGRVETL